MENEIVMGFASHLKLMNFYLAPLLKPIVDILLNEEVSARGEVRIAIANYLGKMLVKVLL